MSHQHASDEIARQPRTAWFTCLDTIEPVRPALYGVVAASRATCGMQKTCYRKPCFEVSLP
jgi:hypothetical protein